MTEDFLFKVIVPGLDHVRFTAEMESSLAIATIPACALGGATAIGGNAALSNKQCGAIL